MQSCTSNLSLLSVLIPLTINNTTEADTETAETPADNNMATLEQVEHPLPAAKNRDVDVTTLRTSR